MTPSTSKLRERCYLPFDVTSVQLWNLIVRRITLPARTSTTPLSLPFDNRPPTIHGKWLSRFPPAAGFYKTYFGINDIIKRAPFGFPCNLQYFDNHGAINVTTVHINTYFFTSSSSHKPLFLIHLMRPLLFSAFHFAPLPLFFSFLSPYLTLISWFSIRNSEKLQRRQIWFIILLICLSITWLC